jgi:hypothetical protein
MKLAAVRLLVAAQGAQSVAVLRHKQLIDR